MNKLFITLAIYLFSLSLTAQHTNIKKVLGTSYWQFAGEGLGVNDTMGRYANCYRATIVFNKQGELAVTLRPVDQFGKIMEESINSYYFVRSKFDTLTGILKLFDETGRQRNLSKGIYHPKPTSVKKKL